ncbi:MAG: signal recognition particle-docking protein FtsY, partial [Dokdonella sp.]
GTTGQNAVNQTRQFLQAIGVTGLVVTKLDGTAKGGVVFALAREFGLPIRYVGLGEQIEDLRVFEAAAFVDGLLPASLAKAG